MTLPPSILERQLNDRLFRRDQILEAIRKRAIQLELPNAHSLYRGMLQKRLKDPAFRALLLAYEDQQKEAACSF